MKKNKLIPLVVLLIISLFGIISVQFLWMSNTYKVQTQKFNSSVYTALNRAANKLQRAQAADFFLNRFAPSVGGHQQSRMMPKPAAQMLPFMPSPDFDDSTNMDVVDTAYMRDNSMVRGELEIYRDGVSHKYKLTDNNSEAIQDSINNLIQSINEGDVNAITVFNQFSYELNMRNNPRPYIDTTRLQAYISQALHEQGVDIDYEYGVYKTPNINSLILNSAKYDTAQSDFMYKGLLFPDNITLAGPSNYILDVYFPKKDTFIAKSLSVLLIASFIFIIFITLTFYYTFKTIVKQKKVSDIKSDFINNMTHELKTPIATINLAADNIANPKIIDNPSNIKPFISIIKEENQRMNKQVERVLQMSLIEKDDFQLMPTELNIHELINLSIKKISLLATTNNVELNTHLVASDPICYVDEIHFTNVVLNLLENAIKYRKDSPSIDVKTENVKGGINIEISDNGIGMSKEQQAKAFDKFFRATKGNVHNVKGFGLGLSYVKAILVKHKGDINIKSKLGVGSSFILFLPQINK